MRVHIVLSSTSAAPPSRIPCAEEYSNTDEESTEKSPEPSLKIPENPTQKLDSVSPEITGDKPQEDNVIFLENTVAVNILVERAMHLSLKGTPTPLFFHSFFSLCYFLQSTHNGRYMEQFKNQPLNFLQHSEWMQ